MSAMPRPRPDPGRAAPPPWRETAAAVPWIDPLDPAWDDPGLKGTERLLYFQLRRWLWIHPGWWPNAETLGRLLQASRQTASRALANLCAAGYLRQRPDGGYELTIPAPRVTRLASVDEAQGSLFSEPIDPAPCSPVDEKRPFLDGTPPVRSKEEEKEERSNGEPVRPSVLPSSTEGEGEPVTDAELWEPVIRRALDLPNLAGDTTRARVIEAIHKFADLGGVDAVEVAIRVCEDRGEPIPKWGYIWGILKKFRAQGVPVPEAPQAAQPARTPPMPQNYNPAPPPDPEGERRDRERDAALRDAWEQLPERERAAIRATVLDEHQLPASLRYREKMIEALCLAELRQRMAESPPATRENPAAGSHANVPPPPVQESPDAAPESYRESVFTASSGASRPVPHPAPRASNPPPAPPSGGAARPDRARVPGPPHSPPAVAVPPGIGLPRPAEVVSDAAPPRSPWWTPPRPRRC